MENIGAELDNIQKEAEQISDMVKEHTVVEFVGENGVLATYNIAGRRTQPKERWSEVNDRNIKVIENMKEMLKTFPDVAIRYGRLRYGMVSVRSNKEDIIEYRDRLLELSEQMGRANELWNEFHDDMECADIVGGFRANMLKWYTRYKGKKVKQPQLSSMFNSYLISLSVELSCITELISDIYIIEEMLGSELPTSPDHAKEDEEV